MKPLTQQTLFFLPRACFTRQNLNCCQVGILLRAERLSLKSRSCLACSCLAKSFDCMSHFVSTSPFFKMSFLYLSKNKYTRTILSLLSPYVWCGVSEVLACGASMSSLTTISQWRKNKRGECRMSVLERKWEWKSRAWESDGLDEVCRKTERQVRGLREWFNWNGWARSVCFFAGKPGC